MLKFHIVSSGILGLLLATNVSAVTIAFTATDLADVVVGEDLWQYDYQISDNAFLANESVSIYFDPMLFSNLQDPPAPVNADWDAITLEPDPGLPDDGIYDALALVDSPSLDDLFSLTFVYLGAGAPGSQTYELFDANFSSIETGNTVSSNAVVPLPPAAFLLMLGLGLINLRFRKI